MMHAAELTRGAPPPLIPCLTEVRRPRYLWRVFLRPIGRHQPHTWQGWAHDAEEATQCALEDARQRWLGFSFVVFNVQALS